MKVINMKKELQNKIIYQVFTRNYTREGTFKALENHLKNIKELGTDIIYLLPISPTGEINRKGDLGSPYSIKDYMQIDPLQGDEKDLIHLINEIHKLDMKVMIDIVFNHTSYNSKLYQTHPEWFFKDNDNVIRSKCADWSDVIDLNYKNNDAYAEMVHCMSEFKHQKNCDEILDIIDTYIDFAEAAENIK